MAVITISKEYGTDSKKVASLAAEKLGYEYIGKHLLSEIANELNISESEAEIFSQTSSSKILRHIDKYTCSLVQKVVDGEHGCLDDDKYYQATKKIVEELYEEGNVIILGWGGQCILSKKPDVLHVRLRKDDEEKIKTAMAAKGIDQAAAKKLVKKEENDLESYIKQFFNKDWNDASLYDIVIDMGKVDAEKATQMICDNIKHKL